MQKDLVSIFFGCCLGFFCLCTALAQSRSDPPRREIIGSITSMAAQLELSPEKKKRFDSFILAWKTIRDNYFDPTFGNLNWEGVRKEFEPRVLATTSDQQLYDLLNEMIGRLNKSHFAIIQPEVLKTINTAKRQAGTHKMEPAARSGSEKSDPLGADDLSDNDGDELEPTLDEQSTFGIGVEVRILDNKFVITRVEKNSAAEYHGLKPGFIIEKVNGVSLSDMLRRIDTLSTTIRNARLYLPMQVVNWFLNGKEDTSVTLSFLDETDTVREVKIPRERLRGQSVSIGKNYPVQNLDFQTESLGDDIGYVRFNIFAMPVIAKFCDALTSFRSKKGMIIDLRGNMGGLIGTMVGLGGMLTDSKVDLGTEIFRVGSDDLMANSKAKHFNGQIVLLIDSQSVSSAEVFAAALKENNRAVLVGDKSAGAALPASSIKLPTGGVLIYPIANFKTRNGNYIEGKGVEPNYPVSLTRKQLLTGHDPQLEEAVQLIQQNAAIPKVEKLTLSAGDLPPPPAIVKKPPPALKNLATVTVEAPPPPAVRKTAAPSKDADSLRIIAEFLDRIGGAAALTAIKTYEMTGKTKLNVRTTEIGFTFHGFRDGSDKYGEVMSADETGEIREIYNGKTAFVQADYGMDIDFPLVSDASRVEILAPLLTLTRPDAFTALTYRGAFDRSGRKTHVIEGTSKNGGDIALAFDVETKMLVRFTERYATFSFGDYRKVGDLMLPFYFEREPIMKIQLDDIKLNSAIDPRQFTKKQNCFDIAN